ncbi:MAG: tetratricopeptide repeat protein [Desulfobacterales bacterium]
MKRAILIKVYVLIAVCLVSISHDAAFSQEIMLDHMEKCGDLICYPAMKDPNSYYYLPDQPRLAYKDGKPQFSFLKYAQTKETGKAGTGQAEGGGIIHFLVTYGVSDNRVKQAERQLQKRHPEAMIVGPIVYRRGNFALITSFKEGNELTTKTVAVGKAPLMEGQKAAVSMALTREGAELLWESFRTDTPDISLVFDMAFAGIREPYEATLEANWSQISKHDRIKAGFQYKWFGADVDILFQELRRTGAVKITTKGEQALMDKMLESANEKLLKVMFDPVQADDLTRAASESGYDSLNQAAKMLKDAASSRRSSSGGSSGSGSGARSSESRRTGNSKGNGGFWAAISHVVLPLANAFPIPVQQTVEDETQSTEGDGSADQEEHVSRAARRFEEGVSLFDQGRYREALRAFEEAEQIHIQDTGGPSTSGTSPYNIGMCHLELGNLRQAERNLEEAVRRYPDGSPQQQRARDELEQLRDRLSSMRRPGGSSGTDQIAAVEDAAAESAGEAYSRARRLYEEARTGGFEAGPTRTALEAYESYQRDHHPTGTRADEVNGRIRMLQTRLLAAEASESPAITVGELDAPSTDLPNPFEQDRDATQTSTGGSSDSSPSSGASGSGQPETGAQSSSTSNSGSSGAGTSNSSGSSSGAATESGSSPGTSARQASSSRRTRADGSPGFSLVASYKMKRIKRSGKMVYHMNHFRTETQAFAMAENIGSIFKKYGRDKRVFRAVTIDDPVFKQREIRVTLDGQDAATFTKYLNFVTVKMKKRHQRGDLTTAEIVITPDTFSDSGNHFSMTYGWKNDADRTRWLNYEYQAIWSFHGGVEMRSPWIQTDSPMLALSPPHRYRTLSIEGNGDVLSRAGVRHGVVTLLCRIGDRYLQQRVTIRNNGPAPSTVLEVPEDPNNPETKVGITWYLTENRKVTSEESGFEGDIIYWDQLPKGGI